MRAAKARGQGTRQPRGAAARAPGRGWKERRRERRGKTEREGGGAHLGAWTIAATAHRITPRANEVEERWERGGREIGGGCCAGKTNEIEREGRGAHGGGGWGARAGRDRSPQHTPPQIENHPRIEIRNVTRLREPREGG